MITGPAERKSHLRWGLLLASAPAILFLPLVALLAICPPRYGPVIMMVVLIVFAVGEVVAGWKLSQIVRRPLDWVSGAAVTGMFVAVVVLIAVAWGFIAPHIAKRAGY